LIGVFIAPSATKPSRIRGSLPGHRCTTAGHSIHRGCEFCRPQHKRQERSDRLLPPDGQHQRRRTGLSLPFDAEPYGPGDSEYAAGQRLLARARSQLGARFADYLVVDGGYATAPFLHASIAPHSHHRSPQGQPPGTFSIRGTRFAAASPTRVYRDGKDRLEIWDADDFAPWETLRWDRVSRHPLSPTQTGSDHGPSPVVDQLPSRRVGSLSLYHLAKSRWEIEIKDSMTPRTATGWSTSVIHHPNSILIGWLLVLWPLVIERL